MVICPDLGHTSPAARVFSVGSGVLSMIDANIGHIDTDAGIVLDRSKHDRILNIYLY